MRKANSIKNYLFNIIEIIKNHLNIADKDLIEPDFVVEGGTLDNLQKIVDKEHIFDYINATNKRNKNNTFIIVRQLSDFFILKRNIKKKKLLINIVYLPSFNSFLSFLRVNKSIFYNFIKILIASTKRSRDITLKYDIIIDTYDHIFRRISLYDDLIKAIKKTGKTFIFLSSFNQRKLLSLGSEYKSIDLLENINLFSLISLYIKNIPNIYQILKEVAISKKFQGIRK